MGADVEARAWLLRLDRLDVVKVVEVDAVLLWIKVALGARGRGIVGRVAPGLYVTISAYHVGPSVALLIDEALERI